MDYNKACEIMDLKPSYNFNHKDLKHKYYKLALKYHPDHNQHDPSSTERFQELLSAYEFLCLHLNIEKEEIKLNNDDYFSLFKNFLSSEYNINLNNIDSTKIINDCKNASFKLFDTLDKKTALNIFNYMEDFSDVINIDDTIKKPLKNILKEKIKNDECIELHSTIDNLFNYDIYKLDYVYNNEKLIFYIPLWHDEIIYELSDEKLLIVKCTSNLPDHIKIDHNNNLHVYIKVCLSSLFKKETICVPIHNKKKFEIPISELRILKDQTYTFYRKGIPTINSENIYSTEKLANVYVHIEIVDI